MNKINDGGPAFGQVVELRCVRVEMDGSTEWEPEAMVHGGLTVRDWFAGKALEGLIAEPVTGGCVSMVTHCTPNFDSEGSKPGDRMATAAYALADAMLRARGEA
ncbi:hypothetical protein KTE50_28440 [Burkholderia multivorans]|uniref:hypothetical protein n=1 Tax=Burkholderia multivorans TaxID=87883 RepID=UPI001C2525BB|nr:hypothetical protein [Burkholderia multivorans]MBU9552469.1 hypothetical protein [Burkholderia multivorans]